MDASNYFGKSNSEETEQNYLLADLSLETHIHMQTAPFNCHTVNLRV